MHKKLSAELIHLAHKILKINNDTDIKILRDQARKLYEDLSVLYFIDDYFVETPTVKGNKDDFLRELENLTAKRTGTKKETLKPKTEEVKTPVVKKEFVPELPKKRIPKATTVEDKKIASQTDDTIKKEVNEIVSKVEKSQKKEESVFEKEMKDSIPADIAADMFQKLEKKQETTKPVIPTKEPVKKTPITQKAAIPPKKEETKPHINVAEKQPVVSTPIHTPTPNKSLNNRFSNQKLQVGLNDRIAFVKHLFNFSQEDFNIVLSKLNNFTSEQSCLDYINNEVKNELDWSGKEEYEERLLTLVERKFK